MELPEQVNGLDAIIAPCSGGGLHSVVAVNCEGTGTRVFGAEPGFSGADGGRSSFLAGETVAHMRSGTIAEGLIGFMGNPP